MDDFPLQESSHHYFIGAGCFIDALDVHGLGLDLVGRRVAEFVILPAGRLLLHHLDPFLHELLAVDILVVDEVAADHLRICAMGQALAGHVVDDDIEIPVDKLPRGVADFGIGLVGTIGFKETNGFLRHRGRFILGPDVCRQGRVQAKHQYPTRYQ